MLRLNIFAKQLNLEGLEPSFFLVREDMQSDVLMKVRSLAQEVSEREGCQLYDVEFSGGPQGRVLRIFIERSEGQVSLDDCANVSRGLNLVLDSQDLVPGGQYELEVSSPGIERRLSELWHFEKAVGQPIRLRTSEAVSGGLDDVKPQTLIDGELLAVSDGQLKVLKDGREWMVPRAAVTKAHVRFVVPDKSLKGKKKR
ncbi:MAG: ribosome maturation factor RimP [Bdellovibrionales bacterium]|nr:ribosome maturation factor RimP [Bdellovibrionales bacterium]